MIFRHEYFGGRQSVIRSHANSMPIQMSQTGPYIDTVNQFKRSLKFLSA